MFICRGSGWEAETQGSPGQLFPPVPFLADTIRTSYMKMGGGGGSGGGPSRVYSLQMQGFCLPCLCLLPPGPFPREGD